jgi:hypothetical protein
METIAEPKIKTPASEQTMIRVILRDSEGPPGDDVGAFSALEEVPPRDVVVGLGLAEAGSAGLLGITAGALDEAVTPVVFNGVVILLRVAVPLFGSGG